MSLLHRYIAAWRLEDVNGIVSTLAADCVIVESFGPIYRGRDRVAQWVAAWLAENGRVLDWTIHDLRSGDDWEAAEWTFRYRWRDEEKSFDGATIAKLRDGEIGYLREYATTATLYDWRGEWR